MNENERNENEVQEYEAPEVFELGRAEELTHGHRGDSDDGLNGRLMFAP